MEHSSLIRQFGEDFVRYLYGRSVFQQEWDRKQLEVYYHLFKTLNNWNLAFSTFLFKSSRLKPRLLQVFGGVKVVFDKRTLKTHDINGALHRFTNTTVSSNLTVHESIRRRRFSKTNQGRGNGHQSRHRKTDADVTSSWRNPAAETPTRPIASRLPPALNQPRPRQHTSGYKSLSPFLAKSVGVKPKPEVSFKGQSPNPKSYSQEGKVGKGGIVRRNLCRLAENKDSIPPSVLSLTATARNFNANESVENSQNSVSFVSQLCRSALSVSEKKGIVAKSGTNKVKASVSGASLGNETAKIEILFDGKSSDQNSYAQRKSNVRATSELTRVAPKSELSEIDIVRRNLRRVSIKPNEDSNQSSTSLIPATVQNFVGSTQNATALPVYKTKSSIIKCKTKKTKTYVTGVRPKFLHGGKQDVTLELALYDVPFDIKTAHERGEYARKSCPYPVSEKLSAENYTEKFTVLLYLEELQHQKDIEKYEMKKAAIKRTGKQRRNLLYLDVPGLAEKRPSLLVGDRVMAVKLDAEGNEDHKIYEGFVHLVEQLQVGLGFNNSLLKMFQNNMRFNVSFTFNRKPLRLMHRALELMRKNPIMSPMLFPDRPPERSQATGGLVLNNRNIEKNKEQKMAVENIVLGITSPIYIIFGPPGTGKTVTMVEAIQQTLKKHRFNILVCALSNFACDMLAERLHNNVDKAKMIRLYAASRDWKDVSQKIKESIETNYKDGDFTMLPMQELLEFRVIVCTFVTAGRLASLQFPNDHFQRIFVDESGQALEPECLIAISGILARDGKVILAGDPKQLGPIIRSPIAMRNGLQISLLQRLMDTCPVYQKNDKTGQYNPQCVTKLVENYRSHNCILKISNKKFYDKELKVCADELVRNKFLGWEELPNKRFPIIFHGVQGTQARDKNSPSFYNQKEVDIVGSYVKKLVETRGRYKQKASQIGIVTPYRKQVGKIRCAINNSDIDVGSVEVFQGQERMVIIISTVRSSDEGLTDDAIYHLGFLCDPKRFNVALTRAKALLIIVGNPRLLCLDKYWKSLLKYCLKNDAYRGVRFTADDFRGAQKMKEIQDLFENMRISPEYGERGDEDQTSAFWSKEH